MALVSLKNKVFSQTGLEYQLSIWDTDTIYQAMKYLADGTCRSFAVLKL